MRTVKPKVLEDMIGQLQKYTAFASHAIPEWESVDGQYLGDGRYVFFDDTACTVRLGERWSARYDCARIFRAKATLPESFRGKKLYFHLDFGGEVLVKFGGRIVGAVSERVNSRWISRDIVQRA